MREEPLSNCEYTFIRDGLLNDVRLDGRSRSDFRQVKLAVGAQCGTALCTLGTTRVLCAVSATLTEPRLSRPGCGFITIDVDMSPMGNPAHEHDRLGDRGMELTRLLESVIIGSRCVDVESLCVRDCEEVWKLQLDVRVLDDDGSLLDCASIAAITALKHFRRPAVSLDALNTILLPEKRHELIQLTTKHTPICVTFGLLNNGDVIVVDPTDKEHGCLSAGLVVACNEREEVCAIHQTTPINLTTSIIEKCARIARRRAVDLGQLIYMVMDDDDEKRKQHLKPDGFETTVMTDMLTCREAHPNELIAPGVGSLNKPASTTLQQPTSVVRNEDPLLGVNQSKFSEDAEDKELAVQVDVIAGEVGNVQIEESTVSQRRREIDEIADFLDDLEEGEVMELATNENDSEIDLMSAKKHKH